MQFLKKIALDWEAVQNKALALLHGPLMSLDGNTRALPSVYRSARDLAGTGLVSSLGFRLVQRYICTA